MMSSTVMRGFSAPNGSWKMICMARRWSRSALPSRSLMSLPSNRMAPLLGSISRISSRPSVDLPQPDSPTRPSVSPASMHSATSSTARSASVVRRNIEPALTGKCFDTAMRLDQHRHDAANSAARMQAAVCAVS